MFSPVFQSTSSDISGLECIFFLVILGIVALVLVNLKSQTKKALPFSRTAQTSLSREQAVKLTEESFPKSVVVSSFNWKPSWPTADKLSLDGYYLTNGQSCLVMILTGIIPGALLIWLAMGRTEQVIVDFSKFQGTGQLTLEAKGLRAQQEVVRLVAKLAAAA
jgi:hypothetical protein